MALLTQSDWSLFEIPLFPPGEALDGFLMDTGFPEACLSAIDIVRDATIADRGTLRIVKQIAGPGVTVAGLTHRTHIHRVCLLYTSPSPRD